MMKKSEASALLIHRSDICRDLIASHILDYLVSHEIITEKNRIEIESVDCSGDTKENTKLRNDRLNRQTEKLLDILPSKDATAFVRFVNVLYIDYPWIAKKLSETCEKENEKEIIPKVGSHETDMSRKGRQLRRGVPFPVKNLLTRPLKLKEIRDSLSKIFFRGRGWVVIHGMMGSGKTILAAEAVRDWNDDPFEDGICWISIGKLRSNNKFDATKLLIKMTVLCEQLYGAENNNHNPPLNVEVAIERVRRYISDHPKSLIILDDVWDYEVLNGFDVGCPILVTTQDMTSVPWIYDNVFKIQTDSDGYGLTIEESKELLALWIKANVEDLPHEHVYKIFEKCRGNPMCLTLIGSDMEQYGNNSDRWSFYREKIESGGSFDKISQRKRSFSGSGNMLDNSAGFSSLIQLRYETLDEKLRNYYKDFSLFVDDIRIPDKVFETLWGIKKFEVQDIMNDLIDKSLVMRDKSADNETMLYMVHDMLLEFLKVQHKPKCQDIHKYLLDRYFKKCHNNTDSHNSNPNYSLLPNDGYIHYFLGYHIQKAHHHHLFPEIFLDFPFVINKIRFAGPSDLLNDYHIYGEHFKGKHEQHLNDFVSFISSNAHLLCDAQIDEIQLALCEPSNSIVYQKAFELARKCNNSNEKVYFKWSNQSNVRTSKILSTKLHTDACKCASFSPDNKIVASVGFDKFIRVWDSKTGKQIRTFTGHEGIVNCCHFSLNGEHIVTASDDGTVKLWIVDSKKFSDYEELKSPEPRLSGEYPFIINGNVLTDESIFTYSGHKENEKSAEVKCCSFSTDNRLIVSGGTDKIAHVWDKISGQSKLKLKGHEYAINSCQFSRDGKMIASASADTVIIWCAQRGSNLQTLKHDINVGNCLFSGNILQHVFTSSGRYVCKWTTKGKRLKQYNNFKIPYYVTCCAVCPNEKLIAAGTTNKSVIIWKSECPFAVATFKGHNNSINWVSFNSDGTQLLSCSDDGIVMIWDTARHFGTSLIALRQKFSVRFTERMNQYPSLRIVTPDESGSIRYFLGFEGKEFKKIMPFPDGPSLDISCCALSSDSLMVLFCTADGEIYLHNLIPKETIEFKPFHNGEVTCCAFIENGTKFVTGSRDATFRIYNRTTRRFVDPFANEDLPVGPVVGCKIFSNGTKALIWCENGTFYIINLLKDRDNLIASFEGHNNECITFADVTSNEELIASVSTDKSVTLWRAIIKDNEQHINLFRKGWELKTFRTSSCLRCCRFSPIGNFLALGDDNGKVMVMNLHPIKKHRFDEPNHNDSIIQEFKHSHSDWVRDFAISSDGRYLISIGDTIKMWYYDGKNDENLLQTFKTIGSSMNSLFTTHDFKTIVTVDDAGILYILEIINF